MSSISAEDSKSFYYFVNFSGTFIDDIVAHISSEFFLDNKR